MPLHRRVTIAGFSPDPLWSVLQRSPTEDLAPPGLVASIRTTKPGSLAWWAVGYDGVSTAAAAVDGTGGTIDAQLVYRQATDGSVRTPFEVLRMTSIGETLAAPIEWGRPGVELDLTYAIEGWLQILSIAAGSSPATHLNLSYSFVPKAQ